MNQTSAFRAIGLAWLVASCLDVCSAFVIWTTRGIALGRGLQGIAVGLLGRDAAYQGGWATTLLGLALHFFIMFCVVLAFYVVSRALPLLRRQPVPAGVGFGLLVYIIMYWGVVPLSRIGPRPHSLNNDLTAILIHICLIGLPTALIVSRFSQPAMETNQ
jgi:hypothetical protein